MRKILYALCLIIGLASVAAIKAKAQTLPIDASQTQAIVDSIAGQYTEWNKLSISGKLSSPMLPMSASVKIYMEKDAQTIISLSAPFVGEVARIEVDDKEVLIVNKYHKKYIRYTIEEFNQLYPGGQDELQNILLGRISLLGNGALKCGDGPLLDIFDEYPEYWVMLPKSDFQTDGAVYFYVVMRDTLALSQFIVMSEDAKSDMTCAFDRKPAGDMTIEMEAMMDGRAMAGTLKLNAPVVADKPLERISVDAKYKRAASLKELMK